AVPTKTIKPLRPFFFFREKRNKKTRPLPPQQRGFCSRARLKISKGQVVFFEKITQKISTFKPLPIFILSVLFSLPKARLSKNKKIQYRSIVSFIQQSRSIAVQI